ncbi:MAG: GDP-mannose 4,6-dehydratase [Candidatus Eremiobacterota bacterium]
MSTVLVTGVAGFIGSHTAVRLLDAGHQVVGADSLSDYYAPERKRSNLEEVLAETKHPEAFHFLHGDLRDPAFVSSAFAERPIDRVIHLAALPGVRSSIDDPRLYYEVNLLATLGLLEAARDHTVENFVFASTSSVYGDTRVIPFVESDRCDRPLAPYPASKRAAEMLGFTFHHLYGMNFTALRFFTVYGPRGRPDMMAHRLFDSVFFEREAALYNGGEMHRDWTYVEDIVCGVAAAVERPLGYATLNLGRGEPVRLADFVAMVEETVGKPCRLVPAPRPDTDILYTWADISKAREMLDYHPRVSAREGIRRFWEWYRAHVL